MPGTHVVDILLLDLPVALWATARQYADAVAAELPALAEKDPDGPLGRLAAVHARLSGDFAEAAAPSELELHAAAARRTRQVDVAYGVLRASRDDLAALAGAYEEAEQCFRAAGLDHLIPPPEIVAFRRWFLGQVVAQLDGALPTPWGED